LADGRNDRRTRRGWHATSNGVYRKGLHGYNGSGSKAAYSEVYRRGYMDGYREGYGGER
jgi:hypothetical protein